jgi:DNA-binding MarR family transcriptional regulator
MTAQVVWTDDALSQLVGPVRAAVLRLLAEPTTMGGLAAELAVAPSLATYHCAPLISAGLVARVRTGRTVRVQRTPRGDALVGLLT